jgi:uncharacterized membrane protein YgdD (TMEM256/DUF423 family)
MQPTENPTMLARLGARHRLLIAAGGIAGAVGVATAAAASHGESRNLSVIASICLAHGPALLALGLAGASRLFWWSAILLAGGTVLFAADLAAREWVNHGLFTGAAPLGGMGMIAGWLALVIAALVGARD